MPAFAGSTPAAESRLSSSAAWKTRATAGRRRRPRSAIRRTSPWPDADNNIVRKVDHAGVITTVAGTGADGFSGDGGSATAAELNAPAGLAVGADGSLYIADQGSDRVRKVDAAGVITTIAGGGT